MRRLLLASIALTALTGFSVPSFAEAQKFVLDKPHTQIIFNVDHMGLSRSYGKFLNYEGFVNLDEAAPEKSSVEVTIQTDSLDLGDSTWNEHVKAEKLFDVAKYPTMTFKSTKVEKTGDHTANVTGDFTLRGVTKPVVLAVTHRKTEKHPFSGKMATGFSATTTIKRSDFGMTEGIPMVGDEVSIIIDAEGAVEGAANP